MTEFLPLILSAGGALMGAAALLWRFAARVTRLESRLAQAEHDLANDLLGRGAVRAVQQDIAGINAALARLEERGAGADHRLDLVSARLEGLTAALAGLPCCHIHPPEKEPRP